ncbi:MAG: DUF2723 domain-containing protein [bacterium]|nr:DUF2723 domain-containing protein [bacterium]
MAERRKTRFYKSMVKTLKPHFYLISAGLFLSFLILYSSTCTRTVQGGDTGEYMTVLYKGGVPHPPGYPLYVLAGRVFSHLPFGTPAFKVSLTSSFFGALTIALLFLLLFGLTKDILSSGLASAIFGLTPLFWRYSSVAEVRTLNTCIITAVLLAALKSRRHTIPLLFLLAGLGLSNHYTVVLVFPVFLTGLYFAGRRKRLKEILREYGLGILFFLFGLTPYLYLKFIGSKSKVWAWGYTQYWRGLLHHVLRKDYSFKFSPHNVPVPNFVQVKEYLFSLPGEFFYFPLALAVLGLFVTIFKLIRKRKWSFDKKMLYGSFLLSFLLSSVFFLSLMNVEFRGLSIFVVRRFYIMPNLILVIFMCEGIRFFLKWKRENISAWSKISLIALSVLIFIPLNYPKVNLRNDTIIQDYCINALKGVEKNGLILGSTDTHIGAFLYIKEVLEIRRDVQHMTTGMLGLDWCHKRLLSNVPNIKLAEKYRKNKVEEFIQANIDRFSIYITDFFHPSFREEKWKFYPSGVLIRLLSPGERPPTIQQVERINKKLFSSYQFHHSFLPEKGKTRSSIFYEYYALPWLLIGKAYQKNNNLEKAQENYERARKIVPWKTGFDKWLGISKEIGRPQI